MKLRTICSLFAIACLMGLSGCRQEMAAIPRPAPSLTDTSEHTHADGTAHADGIAHDAHQAHGAHEAHGHGAGPHEGTVADWGGGKYHVEFAVDHDKQEGTVYILGADEKTPTPIDATEINLSITDPVMQVTLKATPQDSDPAGKASRFVGNHEKLGVVQEYAGTIAGVIDGTPFSGDFKEEPHGDHAH